MSRGNKPKSEPAPQTVTMEASDALAVVDEPKIIIPDSSVSMTAEDAPAFDADADADADAASNMLLIYPVRSYLDGKEIRQAGGPGYRSPKHEALLLVAKGLATDTDPEA